MAQNAKEQDVEKAIDEPLERIKEKKIPGIKASLVILYAIFLGMFAIGWISFNDCPLTRLIPLYLIVASTLGTLAKFFSSSSNKYLVCFAETLLVLYLIWHCLGTYWVYKEYQPNVKDCNRTAFLLAFWILTIQHTLLALFILLSGCYILMKDDFK